VGAAAIHLPLAWVLCPLLSMAAWRLRRSFRLTKSLRRLGQVVIGATVGLGMTPFVVASLVPLLPHIIVLALLAVVLSATFSVIMARYSGIDTKTAFFAVMPGGLSEMGTIGANIGARSEPIVLCQTLRVVFVVCLVPPLYGAFLDIDTAQTVERAELPIPFAVTLVIAGVTTSYLLSLLRLNMPWTIGSLIGVGFLTVILAIDGDMPDLLSGPRKFNRLCHRPKVDVVFLLKMPGSRGGRRSFPRQYVRHCWLALLLPQFSLHSTILCNLRLRPEEWRK